MVSFFHSLGIPTKLSQYTQNYQDSAEKIEKTLIERNWIALGEHKKLTPQDAKKIVEMSY